MITKFKIFENDYGNYGGVAGFIYSKPNIDLKIEIKIIISDKDIKILDNIINNFNKNNKNNKNIELLYNIEDTTENSDLIKLTIKTKVYTERQIQGILKVVTDCINNNMKVEFLTHTMKVNDLDMDKFVDKVNSKSKKIGFESINIININKIFEKLKNY